MPVFEKITALKLKAKFNILLMRTLENSTDSTGHQFFEY